MKLPFSEWDGGPSLGPLHRYLNAAAGGKYKTIFQRVWNTCNATAQARPAAACRQGA
jgi:hypothetical protein